MTSVALAPRRGEPINGRQKVAILLMTVGEEASAQITRNFAPEEVEAISLEIARMGMVDPAVAESVLREWRQNEQANPSFASGGVDYARRVLERAFGPAKAAQTLKRIQAQMDDHASLAHLRSADETQILALIRDEHPQTKALVLALLDTAQAAGLLRALDAASGGDLMARMARMRAVVPEVIRAVELSLGSATGVGPTAQEARTTGGPEAVAALLNLVPSNVERGLLEVITAEDVELSDQIRNLMFVFEDIAKLDARAIPPLIRAVDTRDLALALRVASEELKTIMLDAMSARARDALLEEMEFMGPVKVSEVQKAQAAVVRAVRVLEESGDIVIGGEDDQLV